MKKRLTAQVRRNMDALLVEIKRVAVRQQSCPSDEEFADRADLTMSQCKTAMDRLEAHNIIERITRDHNSRRIVVLETGHATSWTKGHDIGKFQRAKSAARVTRTCLRCRCDFQSEGIHNRLCTWCRSYVSDHRESCQEYSVRVR